MIKLKQLKERAEAFNEFLSLPISLLHPELLSDPMVMWGKEKVDWYLSLSASIPNEMVMHSENFGKYRLAYIHYGPDGEEQALPFTDSELSEIVEYDYIMFTGGLFGDSIPDLIKRMKDWLRDGNNVRIS